ncbi:S8 family serine peptidase [Deinococcus roseus]|uniref:Peptidase S8/S53 domain-containing protein n=1 Tax=Deinococcus roseus TaxID=392414 RepID=A0ABQ2DJU1_9DEIO|nr:S8 family serine peptidase [Deinococcus roseus]GGJ59624.1 hypothetical protein GCM10008938_52210 [Deinococcus roseus]
MKPTALLMLTLMLSALTACSEEEETPKVTYKLNSVVPTTASPGDSITLVGKFPGDAKVMLSGQVLPSQQKAEGLLDVTLPTQMLAGEVVLQVTGTALQTVYTVLPKINKVSVQENVLHIEGVGWNDGTKTASDLTTFVQGTSQDPVVKDGELLVNLGNSSVYGPVQVRVQVNKKSSPEYYFTHEAAIATGKVLLPASSLKSPVAKQLAVSPESPSNYQQLAVYLQEMQDQQKLKTLASLQGAEVRQCFEAFFACQVHFPDHASASEALSVWQKESWIVSLHPDDVASVSVSNNPCKPTNPDPLMLGSQWHLTRMNMMEAWKKTLGKGITVAVVDSGVLSHPEFADRLLAGHDFVDGDENPTDTYGHGTHVAGLIGANLKLRGTAPEASLLPVRVLDSNGSGDILKVAQGILYAAGLDKEHPNAHPAQIINLSLGLNTFNTQMPALESAIQQAQGHGVLVVAATGNDRKFTPAFPASMPGVIAVTSVAGPTDTYQPTYANRGPGTLIAAFGGDLGTDQDHSGLNDGILSTAIDGKDPVYGLCAGTSMAAPQVSGILALGLAQGIAAKDLVPLMTRSAVDLDVYGKDLQTGYGLINPTFIPRMQPDTFVVALDAQNGVITWAAVQENGRFTLNNLPPSTALKVLAASDLNHNHILGETGEGLSAVQTLNFAAHSQTALSPFTLTLADGKTPVTLTDFEGPQ